MHTVNLESFVHGGTNITGIRMIDPNDQSVKDVLRYFRVKESNMRKNHTLVYNETNIKVRIC